MFQETAKKPVPFNGVIVDDVLKVVGKLEADAQNAQFQFRADNKWIGGAVNRSSIKGFFACKQEDTTRDKPFYLGADEPLMLAGNDSAPNPVEFLLHALVSCLTTTMVVHGAVQGIEIGSVESQIEGDVDVRGFFGLSDEVRKGFHHIRVRMTVQSEASAEKLRELAMFSPVFDIVSNSLPTELVIDRI